MKSYFPEKALGLTLSELTSRPLPQFAAVCKRTAEEGMVLLKNENGVLPIKSGSVISVFEREQK